MEWSRVSRRGRTVERKDLLLSLLPLLFLSKATGTQKRTDAWQLNVACCFGALAHDAARFKDSPRSRSDVAWHARALFDIVLQRARLVRGTLLHTRRARHCVRNGRQI